MFNRPILSCYFAARVRLYDPPKRNEITSFYDGSCDVDLFFPLRFVDGRRFRDRRGCVLREVIFQDFCISINRELCLALAATIAFTSSTEIGAALRAQFSFVFRMIFDGTRMEHAINLTLAGTGRCECSEQRRNPYVRRRFRVVLN